MLGGTWGAASTAWVCDGRTIHVVEPALPQLVSLVLSHTPLDLVCGTVRDAADGGWIVAGLYDRDHPMTSDFLQEVADGLAELWFGCPRWTAQEVWWRALGAWPQVDGELSLRGVDVMALPAPRATNTIRALLTKWESGEKEAAQKLSAELTTPPPRVAARAAERELEDEVEGDGAGHDFLAVMELASKAR